MDNISYELQTSTGILGEDLYHTVITQGDKLLGFVHADGSVTSVDWPPIIKQPS